MEAFRVIRLSSFEAKGRHSLASKEIMASGCGMWSEPFTSADNVVLPGWVMDGRPGPGKGGGSLNPGNSYLMEGFQNSLMLNRPLNSTADTDPWTSARVSRNLSLPLDPHWAGCVCVCVWNRWPTCNLSSVPPSWVYSRNQLFPNACSNVSVLLENAPVYSSRMLGHGVILGWGAVL